MGCIPSTSYSYEEATRVPKNFKQHSKINITTLFTTKRCGRRKRKLLLNYMKLGRKTFNYYSVRMKLC
jgi:hypothetical protein